MNAKLQQKLKTLPKEPGVYFHKGASGEIIYVGKAAILRNRVRQYFQKSRLRDVKTDALVAEIVDTDWMIVESELEALFLEAEMVRRYMPRYNILLRDDKAMSYIRVDYDSDYPTVTTTRHPLDDKARYFGPYFSTYQIREALKVLRRVFPFATKRASGQSRENLHYHLGLDPGLESGKTSLVDYRKNLRRLMSVIEGKKSNIEHELQSEMDVAAREQRFEDAARIRNQLRALHELGRKVIFSDKEFLDISKDRALTGLAKLLDLPDIPRRIEGYDISHMSGTSVVASMVVFMNGVSDKREYRKFKLTRQVNDDAGNMKEVIARRLSEKNVASWGVPSMLLIDGGKPQLHAALEARQESVLRFRGLDHDKQLIANAVIVGVAKREEEIYVHKSLSKARLGQLEQLVRRPVDGVSVRNEGEYYSVNLHVGKVNASGHSKNLRGGMSLSPYDDVVKLFQRIRDESHRFAVSYHTSLKRSGQTRSVLDDIPGVGPATRKKLIRKFGSVKGVMSATIPELVEVLGEKRADVLYQNLHGTSGILE